MIDWLLNLLVLAGANWNTFLGLVLYWIEVVFCLIGYTFISMEDVAKDVKARAANDRYAPSITIGTLVGRAFVSIFPGVNLFASVFSVAPYMFGNFFDWLSRVFSFPLVPKLRTTYEPSNSASQKWKG